ncbi:MAG: hypothetical protein KJ879_03745, partial [Nanoarchaeota archaeon]|nr:hypothetical protein [Nanoarchaeota archaeon]
KLVNGLPIQLASVSSQGGATLDSGNSLYSISRDSVGNLPDSILVQFYNYSSSWIQQINYSVGIISLTNDSITLDVSCGDEKFLEDLPSLTCTDSDIGLNYVLKGTVSTNDNPYGVGRSAYPINKFNDFCGDQVGGISSDLVEYYCNEKNQVESEIYSCPNGCFDGACVSGGGSGNVSIPSTQNFSTNCSLEMLSTKSCIHDGVNYKVSRKTGCDLKIEYTGVQEDLELLHLSKWTLGNGVTVMASRDVSYSCSNADLMLVFEGKGENNVTCENSCVLDGECVPIGYRTDDEFCDLGYVFNPQRLKAEKCLNNFECDSNYCASGECVSAGMMRRIIEWLKRVF